MRRLQNLERNDLRSISRDEEKQERHEHSGLSSQQQSPTADSGVETMSPTMADDERKSQFFDANDRACRVKDRSGALRKDLQKSDRDKAFVGADDYTSIRRGNNENDDVYVIRDDGSSDGVDTLDDCFIVDDDLEMMKSVTPLSRYSTKNFLNSFLSFTSASPSMQKCEAFDLAKTMDDLLELREERLGEKEEEDGEGRGAVKTEEEPLLSMADLEDSLLLSSLLPCTPPPTENGLEIPCNDFSGVDVEFLSRWLLSSDSSFTPDRDGPSNRVGDVLRNATHNVDEKKSNTHNQRFLQSSKIPRQSVPTNRGTLSKTINSTQSEISVPFGERIYETSMDVSARHRDIVGNGASVGSSTKKQPIGNHSKQSNSVYPVVIKTMYGYAARTEAGSNYMNEFAKFLEVEQTAGDEDDDEDDRHWFSCPKSSWCKSCCNISSEPSGFNELSELNFLSPESCSNCGVGKYSAATASQKKDCQLNVLSSRRSLKRRRVDSYLTASEGGDKRQLYDIMSTKRLSKRPINHAPKRNMNHSQTLATSSLLCSSTTASAGESERQAEPTQTSPSCQLVLRQRGVSRKRKCFCCSDKHVENSPAQKMASESPKKHRKKERKKTKEIDRISLTSDEIKSFSATYECLSSLESKLFRLLRVLFPSILELSGLKEHSHSVERLLDRMIYALQDSYDHVHMQNQSLCCPSITLCLSPAGCLLSLQRKTLEFLRLLLPSLQPEEIRSEDLEKIIERVIDAN